MVFLLKISHKDIMSKLLFKDLLALVLWTNGSQMSIVQTKVAMFIGSPWVLGGLK